jgi:hypothetical protein
MSIEAIAVLPESRDLAGEVVEGDWAEGPGPGGGTGLWRRLQDGILLNLGMSIQAPDADLYEAARRWMGSLPARIWVFPDTAAPEEQTAQAIQAATQQVGRWIQAGAKRRSILEDLGFSSDEHEAWQREMNSGNPERIQAAVATLEKRLSGRDPAEVEALLASLLQQG